jgi:hypothetical protein
LSEAAGGAGRFPDVWPALAARLAEEGPAPRRLRRRVWVVGVTVAALIAFNPVAYLVPRFQEAVDAMVRQEPAGAALRGALVADPGLFGLWSAGAFQPIQASATVDGVTLTILGTYFDSQVTVLPFAVSGPNHASAQSLAELWSPVTSNVDAVSWASAGTASGVNQTTALQQYPIYLTDQWGIAHPVQNWSYNAATGEGAFTFAGYPGWLRQSGLRLVLHVGAMEEVTAPQGPFGPKTLRYAAGPWDVAFTALPPREPALDTSPNVTVTGSGGRITLSTIRNAPSGSWMTVSSEGAPLLTGLAVQWVVESPDRRKIEPLGWQGSPHGVVVQWPPLTRPGVYRLQLTTAGHTWSLLWQQPAWDASLHWAEPSAPALLYQGTSWADAASLLGNPALPPPTNPILAIFFWVLLPPIAVSLQFLFHAFRAFGPTRLIGAFGLAVIALTLLLRGLLFPLFRYQIRTQRRLQQEQQRIAPQLNELRKKYKSDPRRQQAEMMAVYKEHGINPLGAPEQPPPAKERDINQYD